MEANMFNCKLQDLKLPIAILGIVLSSESDKDNIQECSIDNSLSRNIKNKEKYIFRK